MAHATHTPPVRSVVGNYHLHGNLGRGGAGTVYRAVDSRTKQTVAVKMLKRNLAGNRKLQHRFAQEFQSASKLDHPNIVRALDYGLDGANAYLVMEYVEGRSLGDLIEADGPLPEGAAVRIVTQVAQALHYAHRRKIVHRDVKPDNILVRADGQVKLTDFGLAKDLDNDLDLTKPATGLGTPHFMAPEQYENAKNAGPASDIYALAATLYTALTGKVPFDACTSLVALTRKLKEAPPSPKALVPDLSVPVDATVRRALDPDPARRPSTSLKFARMLAGRSVFTSTRHGSGSLRVAAPGPDDRRRAVRHPRPQGVVCVVLNGSMSWRAEENDEWPAVLRDVSNGGIGLLLARRFEVGTQLLVPLERKRSGTPTEVWAQVVRVEPDQYGHWFHGCTLLAPLSDIDLDELAQR